MKIAISGSACTGKTTLGKHLAKQLEQPFIEEHFDKLFALPPVGKNDPEHMIRTFNTVREEKQAVENRHSGFVVDRCALDLMNLWFSQGLARIRPGLTGEFHQACVQQMQKYDCVIIPPWGKLPLQPQYSEAGHQIRNMNPWSLLQSHATLMGLARMCLRKNQLLVLPFELDTLEDRISFVLRHLRSNTNLT